MPVQPIRQEILVGGTWVDATPHVRGGNVADIRIQRGFSGEQSNVSVGTCNFTLNNANGDWSNRNPYSPYYGQVGRNVQVRCGLDTGTTSLRLTDTSTFGTSDYDGACALTLDKAVLDITGDIDIRIDCDADDWRGRKGQILAGKYTLAGDQRSWTLFTDPFGYVWIITSSLGTSASRVLSRSTVQIPDAGRIAIRCTVDVNNGAGGNTVTFYTSDTINGSWTILGSAVVNSGTTSLFSSSANLLVGATNEAAGRGATFGNGLNADPFTGKIYSFELRNGIAGTVVARMDATAQAAGTTTWSDGLGTPNTWILQTSAEISSMDWRFWGEMSNSPTQWDSTGTDVIVRVQAGDLRQRLSQGQPALRSPIYRNLRRIANIDGWWTGEDGFDATSLSAEYGARGGFTNANFSVASDFPGTAGALIFTDDTGFAYGNCTVSPTTTGVTTHMWYFKLDELPASTIMIMQGFYTGGTIARATLEVAAASFTITIYSNTGATLVSSPVSFGAGVSPTSWLAMRILMEQNGANVDWALAWYPEGGLTLYGSSGSFVGTLGRPRGWNSPPFTGKFGMELAHVLMSRSDADFESSEFKDSTDAYVGETAAARALRLADEEDLPLYLVGLYDYNNTDMTAQMGAQGLLPVLDLWQECADADGGLLYAARDKYGIVIRFHSSLVNRTGPTFTYTDAVFSGELEPTEGDFGIRNDVSAARPDGSGRGRFVKTSGPLNTSDPRDDPQGIGVAPGSVSVNAWPDERLDRHAEWAVHLGTWDEPRFTSVEWKLHRSIFVASSTLAESVKRLDLGDRFDIAALPLWVGPDTSRQMLRGYTEILRNMERTLQANAAPYTPWMINDFTQSAVSRYRVADDGLSTLVSGITTTATSLSVDTSQAGLGLYWQTGATSMLIEVGGEMMTLTNVGAPAVVGSAWRQTFTVTRSTNGIVKAHSAGAVVSVAEPFYIDL